MLYPPSLLPLHFFAQAPCEACHMRVRGTATQVLQSRPDHLATVGNLLIFYLPNRLPSFGCPGQCHSGLVQTRGDPMWGDDLPGLPRYDQRRENLHKPANPYASGMCILRSMRCAVYTQVSLFTFVPGSDYGIL
jgi:hypothetical protein